MASTPSASALSAVLRCKRSPGSAYRLGLTYGAAQPISRAEKPDKHKRRSPLWGFIFWDAPEIKAVDVRLDSATARGQNKQKTMMKHVFNPLTLNRDPGSYFSPKTCETVKLQAEPSQRLSGVKEHTLNSGSRLSKMIILSCLQLRDSLSGDFTSASEHGVVPWVCADCKRDPHVSPVSRVLSHRSFSRLKSRLLQITAMVSDILAKLGTGRKKNNQLTGAEKCISKHGKKCKPKKGLEPGT